MRLTLKLIEQATVLAQTGNFASAAEHLGISQPTLSRNIAALEESLGLQLFDRGRNGATPTAFGRVLVERGARVLGEAEALRAELLAVAGMDTGRLEIAAGPYATEDPVAQAVAQLVSERPGLRVRVHVVDPNEVLEAVLAGKYELGFGGREHLPPHDQLALELLNPRRLLLACRPTHPLLRLRPSVAQVLSFPLVAALLTGSTAAVAATGDAAGAVDTARHGFSPAIEVNSFPAVSRAAAMPCFPLRRRCWPPTWPSVIWPRWTSTRRSCASALLWFGCETGRFLRRHSGSCSSSERGKSSWLVKTR